MTKFEFVFSRERPNFCFASKVMWLVGYGFAAGCEAVAPPRRNEPDYFRGYAPRVGLPPGLSGPRPAPGAQPKVTNKRTAGHSHRLTSGGKAVSGMTDFEAKPNPFT